MNNEEFRKLVKQLRTAQKDYFATKSKIILKKCIELEGLVDAELAGRTIIKEQLNLF